MGWDGMGGWVDGRIVLFPVFGKGDVSVLCIYKYTDSWFGRIGIDFGALWTVDLVEQLRAKISTVFLYSLRLWWQFIHRWYISCCVIRVFV